jgi:energy-coupling factor transporter ATP-binding protein EcfA2
MKPNILLPSRTGEGPAETFECPNNMVIVGANGSGKTRLGAWIEVALQGETNVHRIAAQRALTIPTFAHIKTLEQAENGLFFGYEGEQANIVHKAGNRWASNPEIHLLNDYDQLLSTLFARTTRRDADHTHETQERKVYIPVPESPSDIIVKIWGDVMQHCEIQFDDGKVSVRRNGQDYHAQKMSDGERVALYLMGQCLCAPPNSIIIIDEPEIHLHKSLMARLWDKLEEFCSDKLLVFITHDLDFASSRSGAKKLWIKEYGLRDAHPFWIWEEIPEIEEIPENLAIEILGNRKNIIFVEGDKGSLDLAIYQSVFPKYHLIPRGGSPKVIESTKAMRHNGGLHHLKAFGIVDSDYRTEAEIQALEEAGIYTINVAEVENLFCIEPIIRIIAANLVKDENNVLNQVTTYIIEALKAELEVQISNHAEREIQFRLNKFQKAAASEQGLSDGLATLLAAIDVPAIFEQSRTLFQQAIDENSLEKTLRIYNRKNLHKQVARFFDLQNNGYVELILRLLKSDKKAPIIDSLRTFMPTLKDY